MTNTDLLKTWYQRVWIEADHDAIDALMSKNAYVEGLDTEAFEDRAAFKQFHRVATQILDCDAFDLTWAVEEGDQVAAGVTLSLRLRDTGQTLSLHNHALTRIVDGRIVESRNLFDQISGFEQLGLMPYNTLQRCLVGQRMGFVAKQYKLAA